MTSLADQLRALGLDGKPAIAECAQPEGDRFDVVQTLVYMRRSLASYERQLAEMHEFAAKWGAPMEEVTDRDDDYRLAAMRLGESIPLLETRYRVLAREDKVARWAAALHHYRELRGRSGGEEDEIYDIVLVQELERIEPALRDMLTEILTEVARLERVPADRVIATFASRTGIGVASEAR